MSARILVVEDEPQLRNLLRLYLERDGHRVTDAGDGPTALAAYDAHGADLVILDLMLPGMQGETVLEALRDAGDVPVLITSAKRSDAERIAGLRAGADDYLAKPFNPHELTARVAAILRRTRGAAADAPPPILSVDGGRLVLDPGSRRYTLAAGGSGRLTPGEWALLEALAARPEPCSTPAAAPRRGRAAAGRGVRARCRRARREPAPQARRRPGRPVADRDGTASGYRLVAVPDPQP